MPDEVLDDVDFDEVLGVEDNEPTQEEQAEVQPKKEPKAAPKPAAKPATKTVATKPASTTGNKPGPKPATKTVGGGTKAAAKPGPKPLSKSGPKPTTMKSTKTVPVSVEVGKPEATGKASVLASGIASLAFNLEILGESVAEAEKRLHPVLRKGLGVKPVPAVGFPSQASFGTQLSALNAAAKRIVKHLHTVLERLEV